MWRRYPGRLKVRADDLGGQHGVGPGAMGEADDVADGDVAERVFRRGVEGDLPGSGSEVVAGAHEYDVPDEQWQVVEAASVR